MPYPEKFTGFQIHSHDAWTDFHKNEFQPKPFEDFDVDVEVEACGICGSDLLLINGSWGQQELPIAVGHGMSGKRGGTVNYFTAFCPSPSAEIIGRAVRVGPKVTLIKPGDRVGIGAQCWSCLDCKQCKNNNETYCKDQADTYGHKWPETGIVSQGGYSSHVRAHEWW